MHRGVKVIWVVKATAWDGESLRLKHKNPNILKTRKSKVNSEPFLLIY